MSQFIQLHLLTSYPPSNVNRDDLGRPKTAFMGGTQRLRISSQSLKRHWRTSDLFEAALAQHIGTRTKFLGREAFKALIDKQVNEKSAKLWATKIAEVFGKNSSKKELEIEQLVHVSPAEIQAVMDLTTLLAQENREPTPKELEQLLNSENMAVDIALFGRMLASTPQFDVEAACQVAHALSVHSVVIEDDYFTALDDLNEAYLERGSSHLGESYFAAALFYSYVCINKTQLIDNLNGNQALANQAIQALVETMLKVTPTGKQNSFASRAYASYVLAESGTQQPRSLSVAYLKAIQGDDQAQAAIAALQQHKNQIDQVYGACSDASYSINATNGTGNLTELLEFVAKA